MRHDPSNLVLFLGHFHPLMVHLPIGGLVLLGILEFLACFTRWKDVAQNRGWILAFVSGTALVSAAFGWMLGQAGGYAGQMLKWHRLLALALSAVCLLTFLLREREWIRAYRISLALSLLLLVAASYLGASITHGPGFLTGKAPGSVRVLMESNMQRSRVPVTSAVMRQPVFANFIEPILQEQCCACHGADKQKARLRLDNLDGLLQGGQNGPVIKMGEAKNSPLVQRMLLPLDADGHMPPEEQPQPAAEEITLLQWWIDAGARTDQSVRDLEPKPEIRRLLEMVSKGPGSVNRIVRGQGGP